MTWTAASPSVTQIQMGALVSNPSFIPPWAQFTEGDLRLMGALPQHGSPSPNYLLPLLPPICSPMQILRSAICTAYKGPSVWDLEGVGLLTSFSY